jgi:hypothetical protein
MFMMPPKKQAGGGGKAEQKAKAKIVEDKVGLPWMCVSAR